MLHLLLRRHGTPSTLLHSLLVLWLTFLSGVASLDYNSNIISLSDKTFDNIHEVFGRPMLILAHATMSEGSEQQHKYKNDVALESFRQLSGDQILRENGVMLVTVDAIGNRMLRLRLGINIVADLPSLIYLYNGRLFRYQGDLSSPTQMRAYALKGFENQGMGDSFLSANLWLRIKSFWFDLLYNTNTGKLNVLFSSFVMGILIFASIAVVAVSLSREDECKNKTL